MGKDEKLLCKVNRSPEKQWECHKTFLIAFLWLTLMLWAFVLTMAVWPSLPFAQTRLFQQRATVYTYIWVCAHMYMCIYIYAKWKKYRVNVLYRQCRESQHSNAHLKIQSLYRAFCLKSQYWARNKVLYVMLFITDFACTQLIPFNNLLNATGFALTPSLPVLSMTVSHRSTALQDQFKACLWG